MDMTAHRITASARIDAAPKRVYNVIADYCNGHPRILPKQFSDLVVERGGFGAGTVIRFRMRVGARHVAAQPRGDARIFALNDRTSWLEESGSDRSVRGLTHHSLAHEGGGERHVRRRRPYVVGDVDHNR